MKRETGGSFKRERIYTYVYMYIFMYIYHMYTYG